VLGDCRSDEEDGDEAGGAEWEETNNEQVTARLLLVSQGPPLKDVQSAHKGEFLATLGLGTHVQYLGQCSVLTAGSISRSVLGFNYMVCI